MGEGALRRLGAGRGVRGRVGPDFDRSLRLPVVVGVMTAAASSSSTTVRITMAPLVLSVTVLVWWVRPRAAIRRQAPWSRSPCHRQDWLGQMAHFQPATVGLSGALRCCSTVRHCGQ
ncbi:hypothetical protein A6A27_35905 [Micromonospora sp. CB01531]|nr:hypothetical protein A6A27_35905 [Micromonospora sp. CB01531]